MAAKWNMAEMEAALDGGRVVELHEDFAIVDGIRVEFSAKRCAALADRRSNWSNLIVVSEEEMLEDEQEPMLDEQTSCVYVTWYELGYKNEYIARTNDMLEGRIAYCNMHGFDYKLSYYDWSADCMREWDGSVSLVDDPEYVDSEDELEAKLNEQAVAAVVTNKQVAELKALCELYDKKVDSLYEEQNDALAKSYADMIRGIHRACIILGIEDEVGYWQ